MAPPPSAKPDSYPSVTPPPTSEPPVRPASGRSRVVTTVVAALGVVALAAVVFALARPKDGALIVTVSGPEGVEVKGLEVLLDGEVRCSGSPCRVEGLTPGQHLVKVAASGYQSVPSKSIAVAPGGQSLVEVALSRSGGGGTVAVSEGSSRQPVRSGAGKSDDTVDLSSLATEEEGEPASRRSGSGRSAPGHGAAESRHEPPGFLSEAAEKAESEPEPAAAEPEPAGEGTLRINSIPPTRIVVDGRPRGTTPAVITVPPGAHSVVFVHETYGRKVRSVSVPAGGSAVASVKFP